MNGFIQISQNSIFVFAIICLKKMNAQGEY